MQAPEDEINKFSYIKDLKRRKMAAMTSIMDEGIGKVVTALKRKKMLDNSIIVFISDNGAPTIGLHSNLGSNYPFKGVRRIVFKIFITYCSITALYPLCMNDKDHVCVHMIYVNYP